MCFFVLFFIKCVWVKVFNRLRIWIKVFSCYGIWIKIFGFFGVWLKVVGFIGVGLEVFNFFSIRLEIIDLFFIVSFCLINWLCFGVEIFSVYGVGVKCSFFIIMGIGIVVFSCNVIWVKFRGVRRGEKNVWLFFDRI